MTFPYGEPVTLLTRSAAGRDDDGNTTYNADATTVYGAFAPGGSSELVQGQDIIITQPTVYLPYGTDVSGVDALVVGGITYEVDGSPNQWRSPWTGRQAGVEVKLRAVTG